MVKILNLEPIHFKLLLNAKNSRFWLVFHNQFWCARAWCFANGLKSNRKRMVRTT